MAGAIEKQRGHVPHVPSKVRLSQQHSVQVLMTLATHGFTSVHHIAGRRKLSAGRQHVAPLHKQVHAHGVSQRSKSLDSSHR